MTAPGPLDPRIDAALAEIERAWRRYCSAANRNAPESTCRKHWRAYRHAQRAFHDVSAEVWRSGAGHS